MHNFKLTKETYNSLWDDNITKAKYNAIINIIDSRFDYIMKTICTKLDWYDYDNGWEETDGHFTVNSYHKNPESQIHFDGQYTIPTPYEYCEIPIKWLWEDFEEEFRKDVENYKTQKANKRLQDKVAREDRKQKKLNMKEQIRAKLSKEELKYIKFK